jgi:anti-sigma factor (TIGR02949 family)
MTAIDRLTCEDVVRRLYDYVDRELSEPEMQAVAKHLETCAHCVEAHHVEARMVEAIRSRLRRSEVPEGLADKIGRLGG